MKLISRFIAVVSLSAAINAVQNHTSSFASSATNETAASWLNTSLSGAASSVRNFTSSFIANLMNTTISSTSDNTSSFETASNITIANETVSSTANTSFSGCSLLAAIPFSQNQGRGPPPSYESDEALAREGYGLMAAALMAIDHFNAHDDTVVSELSTTRNCTFTFPPELFQVLDTNRNAAQTFSGLEHANDFCIVVGPMVNAEAEMLGIALEAMDLPGIAYGPRISFNTATRIVRASIDPLDYAAALAEFLQRKGKEREYVALLSNYLDEKDDFPLQFQNAGSQRGLKIQSVNILGGRDEKQGIGSAMDQIYESGFRTIIIALSEDVSLRAIASAADSRGMLSDEFWWIILDITIPPEHIDEYGFEAGSSFDRLLRGSAIFKLLDGFDWDSGDRFLPAWRSLNGSFVERLNNLYPNTTDYQFRGALDFFRKERPPTTASFIYDAVIAAGLAKCQLDADPSSSEGFPPPPPPPFGGPPGSPGFPPFEPPDSVNGTYPPPPFGGPGFGPPNGTFPPPFNNESGLGPPSGPAFGPPFGPAPGGSLPQGQETSTNTTNWLQKILKTSFNGASGQVSFIELVGVRDANSTVFGIFNIRENLLNASTSGVRYDAVLTDVRLDGAWQTTSEPFIFRDGTSNLPTPNRAISNNNYIPRSVRITGILSMSIAQVISVACGVFVWVYRNDRIMMASQPEFLYMLCFGSFLLAASILTRSFDESVGLSVNQLDSLCMATPWLVSLGHAVVYLSLFSKLWRVQRVFQFRRGLQVHVRHVIGPFLCFVAAILITMTTWQIISPWRWVRVVVEGTPPQSNATCLSKHGTAFVGILAVIVFAVTLLALWMSWKTRDTPADVSDSSRVRFTILTHLQSIIVGVPIIILLNGKSQTALFLGFSLLVSTISITSVSFLIVPKMIYIWLEKKNQGITSSRRNVFISGLDRGGTQGESSSFRSTTNFDASSAQLTANRTSTA